MDKNLFKENGGNGMITIGLILTLIGSGFSIAAGIANKNEQNKMIDGLIDKKLDMRLKK